MQLAPGSRLGPYEVLGTLGAGGMGEVYRARDTRLEREVAIKILPEHLAASDVLRQRFEREAKTISSLSHPHICALYDVGQQDGHHYLVMEYLVGESLADHLARAPLPIEDVIRYGIQIAAALDAAHRRGVTHRDLKPSNVILTRTGAKLLDFGLAKTTGPAVAAAADSALPTQSKPLTEQGTILGTLQYMAPEQLEGLEADGRTDIFALGALLYEMATGQRAFTGRTRTSLIAAIVSASPVPITTLQAMTPPALDHVVQKCLEKQPDDRWQSAYDVMSELQWIQEGGSARGTSAPAIVRRRRERLAWAVTAGALVAAFAFAVLWRRASSQAARRVQSSLLPPQGAAFAGPLALSPDGRRIAFVTEAGRDARLLWVRSLDGLAAQPLSGTEGAMDPFWSPDGRYLGFFAESKLRRIYASGGPVQDLADAPTARGGAWLPGGDIVFAPTFRGGLQRIPSGGGSVSPLTEPDASAGEISHRWPSALPDGRHVLFLSQRAEGGSPNDPSTIEVVGTGDRRRTRLVKANSSVEYSPSGYLLFWRQGALVAQGFDPAALRLEGEAFAVAKDVESTFAERALFSVAAGGTLAYFRGGGLASPSRIAWLDRSGRELEAVDQRFVGSAIVLSHDGRRLAVASSPAPPTTGDIWIWDLVRGARTRLTFDPAPDFGPVWSPDDSRILYTSSRRGNEGSIYSRQSSGLGEEELVLESEKGAFTVDWSNDGDTVIVQSETDIWRYSLREKKLTPLVKTDANEGAGALSPDGRWLAYVSDESGRYEVYVLGLTGPGGKWQVSTGGGEFPLWRRDGKELFYITERPSQLMAVPVLGGRSFRPGPHQLLFQANFNTYRDRPYDVAPDGRRFIADLVTASEGSSPITLVTNWAPGPQP
jgi:Tol biopolymer transport system component